MEPFRLKYQVKIIFILTCLVTFTVHLNIDPQSRELKDTLNGIKKKKKKKVDFGLTWKKPPL